MLSLGVGSNSGLYLPEQIIRQFLRAHPVEDSLSYAQPLAGGDIACPFAIVKAHIAAVGEDGKVARTDHASAVGRRCQALVVLVHLIAQVDTLGIISQFRLPCLRREVGLAKGDDWLLGVGVLHDQIAGIAGELEILDFPLCSASN